MRNLSVTLLSAFIIVSTFVGSWAAKPEQRLNTLSKKEVKEGWQLLFDGKSITDWKFYNGGEVNKGWKVIDGVLHNSGVGSDHGGDIITKKKYANFILTLEWSVNPKSNSGILYHVEEGNYKALYQTGPEYQLLDDKGWGKPINPDQYSGANYAMHTPKNAVVKPVGEWNQTKIVVDGPHVEHWLNGAKVVEYELWSDDWNKRKNEGKWKDFPQYGLSKTGHIGLQDHGGLTMFRNIKIKEL